ncbi:transcriptional regulator [Yersinia enterocolitica]|nr:transcriptional regulator [Yersinia enterocolitica]
MYYVAGQTQHEIAEALGVSRQVAQRLVACAIDNGLVSVSIAHPVGRCMALADQLQKHYGLHQCQVVPSQGMDSAGVQRAIAVAGAEVMAQFLRQEQPLVIGVGSGRSLKAAIDELPDFERPQHSCVSLIGAIAADGSCPAMMCRYGWRRKPKVAILFCPRRFLRIAPQIVTCGVIIGFTVR